MNINLVFSLGFIVFGIVFPPVAWLVYFSKCLVNHSSAAKRKYISRLRRVAFRSRVICYICSIGVSVLIIALSWILLESYLKFILIPLIIAISVLYLRYTFSSYFVRAVNNPRFNNYNIYDKEYIRSKRSERIFNDKPTISKSNKVYFSETESHRIYAMLADANPKILTANSKEHFHQVINLKEAESLRILRKTKFLSLIYIMESSIDNGEEWAASIIKNQSIDFEADYKKNRKKYVEDDVLRDSTITIQSKIEQLLSSKVKQ